MQRLLLSALLLLCASWASAQQIQITTANGLCTYPTGPVKSDPAHAGQLLATATGAGSGPGCSPAGAGGVSFGPASPLAPLASPLGSSGGSVTFTFQAVNAATCTGTVSGASNPTFASSGTGTATVCSASVNGTCVGSKSFSVNFGANTSTQSDASNTVQLTCSGATGGSVLSPAATVTVAKLGTVTTGCTNPRVISNGSSGSFTQWTGTHLVNYGGQGNKQVDVGSFAAVFGGAWPGPASGAIATFSLPVSNYISLQFSTADTRYFPPTAGTLNGKYSVGETSNPPRLSMTISEACGDFSDPAGGSGSTVVPGCYANFLNGGSFLLWWNATGQFQTCVLSPNKTYYLNIINAEISGVTPSGGAATSTADSSCGGASCLVPIQNGPGSWQSYTPH